VSAALQAAIKQQMPSSKQFEGLEAHKTAAHDMDRATSVEGFAQRAA
jgi:hypothetical protein